MSNREVICEALSDVLKEFTDAEDVPEPLSAHQEICLGKLRVSSNEIGRFEFLRLRDRIASKLDLSRFNDAELSDDPTATANLTIGELVDIIERKAEGRKIA